MLYLKGARPGTALCREELRFKPGLSRAGRALSPGSRFCRGSPLHLRPEPEEGPLRSATAGKTKPKSPTTTYSRGSNHLTGVPSEITRR
ncbi:spexin isoform X1 [Trachypithecus francoisi]|uniref:spexin isoform X1 n=1 Tax=Trachypithecus francoisi TaxID=54180 RepID=UPI00141B81CE|nr:spexin isoform X1 [Trachypithecus francoisi]